jgi:hypothetical protein
MGGMLCFSTTVMRQKSVPMKLARLFLVHRTVLSRRLSDRVEVLVLESEMHTQGTKSTQTNPRNLGDQLSTISNAVISRQEALEELKPSLIVDVLPTDAEQQRYRDELAKKVESIISGYTERGYYAVANSLMENAGKGSKSLIVRADDSHEGHTCSPFAYRGLIGQAIDKVRQLQSEEPTPEEYALKRRTYALNPNDEKKIKELVVDSLYADEQTKWRQAANEITSNFISANEDQPIQGNDARRVRSTLVKSRIVPKLPDTKALTKAIFFEPLPDDGSQSSFQTSLLTLIAFKFIREDQVQADLKSIQTHWRRYDSRVEEWYDSCQEQIELKFKWQ